MDFILIPLIVWFASQTLKFMARQIGLQAVPHKGLLWVYHWSGGWPSSHAAVLAASLYLVWKYYGFSPIFAFALFAALVLLFNLAEDRKRQEIFEEYFKQSRDYAIKEIVRHGRLLDISGHTHWEMAVGVAFGWALAAFLTRIII